MKKFLNTPLKIGNQTIEKRVFLAPMAGLGHVAYRELLSTYGGYGLMFTEMCSSRAVPQENRRLSPVFRWRDEELGYLVCQLFGSDPDEMAIAAERIERENFFGVDINFGCSVAAICKKNCGAAVLKDPDRAVAIVSEIRKRVDIPVFVKYRTGWSDDPDFAADMAKKFEDGGADALTFHPRVAPDRRSRRPKWDYITKVKEAVSIPVFGNGNVFHYDDCEKMLNQTGCDGVSLGRIAIAKPWIFSEFTEGFEIDSNIYKECCLKMTESLEKHYDPKISVKLFKKFAIYFAANFTFGHSIYSKLTKGETLSDINENILSVFEKTPDTTKRPNMNMFTS